MALTLRCRICELRDFFLLAFVCWHLNFLSIIRQESYFHCAIETKLSCRKHHKKHKNCTFLMLQHDYPDLRFCCGFYWLFFSLLFQNEVLTLKLFFDKVTKLCQIFEMCHGTSLFTRTSCKWCPPYFLKNPACLSISKYYSMNCESVIFFYPYFCLNPTEILIGFLTHGTTQHSLCIVLLKFTLWGPDTCPHPRGSSISSTGAFLKQQPSSPPANYSSIYCYTGRK